MLEKILVYFMHFIGCQLLRVENEVLSPNVRSPQWIHVQLCR